jgi:hypothetical protein
VNGQLFIVWSRLDGGTVQQNARPDSEALGASRFEVIEAPFANALSNAFNGGSLQDGVDLQTEARFFASHLLGQLTLIRANVAPDVVESAAMVALQHLKSLRRAQP